MIDVVTSLLGVIIGGIIGIVATIISYRLTRSLTFETIKITEYNKFVATFRAAFAP